MNLQIHSGNVTGDLDAICCASYLLDKAYFFEAWETLAPIDAPEKINTGVMVHVEGFCTDSGTVPTQQFQRSNYRSLA